jgi:hypothetical protein
MGTFIVPLSKLLAANHPGALAHVARTYNGLIRFYAAMPASTARPVRVRRDLRIVKGWRRVLAARLRGDAARGNVRKLNERQSKNGRAQPRR